MSALGGTLQRPHAVGLWERFVSGLGLTIALTGSVLLTVTWPVHQADWASVVVPFPLTALLGLTLAALFLQSTYPRHYAHLLSLAAGALLVFIAGMSLVPGGDFANRLVDLVKDVSSWLAAVPTGRVHSGVVEFGMLITALSWLLGYGGGWLVLRYHLGWPLVLTGAPVLLLALSNVGFATGGWLVLFMASSALLLIHLGTVRRLLAWRAKRILFDPITVLSQSAFVLAIGLAAVLIAASLPVPNVAPLRELALGVERTLDSVQREFSRLFNGLPSRLSFKTLTYGDELFFRGNPNLTDQLLFTVDGGPGTYWRARVYNIYTGRGWEEDVAQFARFEGAADTMHERRVNSQYYFRLTAATDTFLTAGSPVAVSQPADALTLQNAPWDVLQLRLSREDQIFPTRTNLRYMSIGSQSAAGENELRRAGNDYPAWVTTNYLQLPATTPARVFNLAWDIASPYDNAYDRAEAIRRHLANYTYNLDISAPPSGRDGVDYFLFDSRQGYCDYFASAMVVLLRSVGIPARYVLGYASGAQDPDTGQFRVLELNYHAWVEVYFPGYGWRPFEPTPANAIEFSGLGNVPIQPPAITSGGQLGEPLPEEEEEEGFLPGDFGLDEQLASSTPFLLAFVGAALLLLAGLVYYRAWWRLGRLDRADQFYAKMLRLAAMLGVPRRPGQTPHEYAAFLAQEFPDNAEDVRTIASVYTHRRFAGHPIPLGEIREAEAAWDRLRWVLVRRLFRVRPA